MNCKAFVICIESIEESMQAAERCIRSGSRSGMGVEKHFGYTPKDNPVQLMAEKNN